MTTLYHNVKTKSITFFKKCKIIQKETYNLQNIASLDCKIKVYPDLKNKKRPTTHKEL